MYKNGKKPVLVMMALMAVVAMWDRALVYGMLGYLAQIPPDINVFLTVL